jgi:hypothetical protein
MRAVRLAILLMALVPAAGPATAAPRPAAVFDIELVDTSGEGEKPGQRERIAATSEALRRTLAESGKYQPIDLSPAADRIAALGFQRSCVQCLLDIARDLGAEVTVTGAVHKVSTLILSMQITVRRVADGKMIAQGTADIRGDNDRAWQRGVEWLVRNRITAPG